MWPFKPSETPRARARRRPLWRRTADTPEGRRIIARACDLSLKPGYEHFTDAQLIRLAYWGTPGEP